VRRLELVRLFLAGGLCLARDAAALDSAVVRGNGLRVEFDAHMRSRIVANFGGKEIVLGPFTPSETLHELGRVSGPTGRLSVSFAKALLLEARPAAAVTSHAPKAN